MPKKKTAKKTAGKAPAKGCKLLRRLEEFGVDKDELFFRFGRDGEDDICDEAVIGVTIEEDHNRLVYDYDLLVEAHAKDFAKSQDIDDDPRDSYDDAQEWVDYNVMRSLPYMRDDENGVEPPIIIRRLPPE